MRRYLLSKKTYSIALIFFLLTVVGHWRLTPDWTIILYLVGAILGLHLLEFIEQAVKVIPSPFRTILAVGIIVVLTIFVLTSSGNVLGQGLVLFLNIRYLLLLQQECKDKGTLNSWGHPVGVVLNETTSRTILRSLWVFLGFSTILFILL